MDNRIKNAITVFFLLLGIAAMYVIFTQHSFHDILASYRNVDPWLILAYAFTITVLYCVLTWRWDVVIRSRGHRLPFHKLFIYRTIGAAINFFTPGPRVGGEPTQATLMTKHGVEFTEGLSTIMIDKIIDTTTSGILFIIGVVLVGLKYSFPRNTEIALTLGGITFVTLIGLFYYRMLTNRHFFLHIFRFFRLDKVGFLKKIELSIERIELIMIEFYNGNKKAFIKCLGISVLSWAVMFVEYKLATTMLGLNLGMAEIFFIVSFIGMAILFPIPMAVGVLEAGQLSAFALIGLSASAGVALAFLVRLKDIAWSLIGLILLAAYGFHVTKVVKKRYKLKSVGMHEDAITKKND